MSDINIERLENGLLPFIPKFEKTTTSIRISHEAYAGLQQLANNLGIKNITQLMEYIGLFQLSVSLPVEHEDDDGLTTQECYASGFKDKMEGTRLPFAQIFGPRDRVFNEAYLRGYWEAKAQQQKQQKRKHTLRTAPDKL